MVLVPGGGIFIRPLETAEKAALKNAGVLQYANWPKTPFASPFTHVVVSPVNVSVTAFDPKKMPTTALSGRVGTTGVIKSKPALVLFWLMIKGL